MPGYDESSFLSNTPKINPVSLADLEVSSEDTFSIGAN